MSTTGFLSTAGADAGHADVDVDVVVRAGGLGLRVCRSSMLARGADAGACNVEMPRENEGGGEPFTHAHA